MFFDIPCRIYIRIPPRIILFLLLPTTKSVNHMGNKRLGMSVYS